MRRNTGAAVAALLAAMVASPASAGVGFMAYRRKDKRALAAV